jgi:hypothetical protein
MKPYEDVMLPQREAEEMMLLIMEHLKDWPLKTAEAFRNAVLGPLSTAAINPMLGISQKKELDFLRDMVTNAVSEGRMIDFGFIPNELIKLESLRSREMYEAGELQHPYDDWVAVTAWEGGFNGYYFSVDPGNPNITFCIELYGVEMPNKLPVVLIYDIVKIEVIGPRDTQVVPAKTIIPEYDADEEQMQLRGANCLDPMVTMLRLLADASIPIIDHPEPVKLNKQRAKQGKFQIPPHAAVHTKDYVAFFQAGKSIKGPSKGGHHASPTAHWRRSHKRHLVSGQVVQVRSSKVNWRDNEEMHRLFYRVPK